MEQQRTCKTCAAPAHESQKLARRVNDGRVAATDEDEGEDERSAVGAAVRTSSGASALLDGIAIAISPGKDAFRERRSGVAAKGGSTRRTRPLRVIDGSQNLHMAQYALLAQATSRHRDKLATIGPR